MIHNQYLQAFLEVPQHAHERLLERIIHQFHFQFRRDIIFYDDFAGTKTYLIEGTKERYLFLKEIIDRLGGCSLTETKQIEEENYVQILTNYS